VGGLAWWVQTQWIDKQRRLWREHDAKLAAAWTDDDLVDNVVVDNVVVLPEPVAAKDVVVVLPEPTELPPVAPLSAQ
jgi:hypothetical protein